MALSPAHQVSLSTWNFPGKNTLSGLPFHAWGTYLPFLVLLFVRKGEIYSFSLSLSSLWGTYRRRGCAHPCFTDKNGCAVPQNYYLLIRQAGRLASDDLLHFSFFETSLESHLISFIHQWILYEAPALCQVLWCMNVIVTVVSIGPVLHGTTQSLEADSRINQ